MSPEQTTSPDPIPTATMSDATVAVPNDPIHLPTKSRTLREIRKVFPKARFQESTNKGIKSVQLFYKIPGTRGEDAPIAHVEVPAGGSVRAACLALLRVAFERYGYHVAWDPAVFPGKFVKAPIAGFQGVEAQLPIELDPDALTEDEFKLATEINEGIKSGKFTQEDGFRALNHVYRNAMARKNPAPVSDGEGIETGEFEIPEEEKDPQS